VRAIGEGGGARSCPRRHYALQADILVHLGEPTAPPRIAPARGPPLWEAADAEHNPAADPLLQPAPAPAFEFDQRIAW